jgi:hypothetical protein
MYLGTTIQYPPPTHPHPNLTIQFFEITYCNDRFLQDTVALKSAKYLPLIHSIQKRGWKVTPLITITTSARASTHILSIKIIHETFIPLYPKIHLSSILKPSITYPL